MAITGKVAQVVDSFLEIGALKLGSFILKLHQRDPDAPPSPYYIDLRMLRSYPKLLRQTAVVLSDISRKLTFDLLADVPTASTPLVTAMMLRRRIPMISPRLDAKSHGLGRSIEGVFEPGQTALVVDDLVTSSTSKLEAIKVLEYSGLVVKDVLVLLDREQGGSEQLAEKGYQLHSVFTITELFDYLANQGRISPSAIEVCRKYLRGELTSGWEDGMDEGWEELLP